MEREFPNKKSASACNSGNPSETTSGEQQPLFKKCINNTGAVVAPGGAPLDISSDLKAPVLPNSNPAAISYEQAHAGVTIHIPGSPHMRCGDVIVFYWGLHKSVSHLYQDANNASVVRVLCITYNFLPHAQYGLVDLYYEVHRCDRVIGRSPTLRVTVNYFNPTTPKQRQRKRSVSRRYPGS
jgi:hypothetical protein